MQEDTTHAPYTKYKDESGGEPTEEDITEE